MKFKIKEYIIPMIAVIYIISFMIGIIHVKSINENVTGLTNDSTLYVRNVVTSPVSIQDSVAHYLFKYNLEHPDIVLRQFILESGYFRSDLFIKYNNAIGMKESAIRVTSRIGLTDNGYAIYESLEDCVLDYKYWQDAFSKGKTRDEYYKHLQKVYASDKYYVSKLKRIRFN